MKTIFAALIGLSFVSNVVAWGAQGHQAVGYVAMQFLGRKTASFVSSTVEAKFNHSLGPAGPWADDFRSTHKWSAPFHFIDALDDPKGGSCSVDKQRDCGVGGCVLTAIANYTQRVADTTLEDDERMQALYFLDHFIGDVGQPLHVEALEEGGNQIPTVCNGVHSELHKTWDTDMIVTMLHSTYAGSVPQWADALATAIKSGPYAASASQWIECIGSGDPELSTIFRDNAQEILMAPGANVGNMVANGSHKHKTTKTTAHPPAPTSTDPGGWSCPLVWAQEANAYGCSNVFNFSPGQDLCSSPYLSTNIPVINEQIAKQGYRLAAWLNVIFDGTPTP